MRCAGIVALAALGVWVCWRVVRLRVGSPEARLADTSWIVATRVLARDGRVLGERPSADGLRGQPQKLDDMGQRLVLATIASEDRRFYDHDGIDRIAVLRALASDVMHGSVISGGSTITQQLVKRLDYRGRARPRTVTEKIREMARAQNLEAHASKNEILEAYLNRLDYGRGLAGPEAAALGYFGVHARDLSLAQATLLAVLPRAPSALDPYRHRDRAIRRQRALLHEMHRRGLVSMADRDRGLAEAIELRDAHAPRPFLAPHLVLARAKNGHRPEVRTTLDFDLQSDLEALVRTHADRLAARGASTVAVVVVDNLTGEVLSEIGSASFSNTRIAGMVDLVRAPRQPGSTLKPFIYARAFEKGVSPMQMLADVPTEFGANAGRGYAPENFDGTFLGPISAREALAGSLNVPAVKLAAEIGAKDVVAVLRGAGLPLAGGAERYGLSIALGSAEVTPLELAEAYVTLARGGEHIRVHELAGEGAAASLGGERIFEASAVAAATDALSDPFARIRGLRARGPFEFDYPVAVKTGTSTSYRDAWTCGYTRERTVVVWTGNADGSPTRKLTGAVGAGPLFFDAMKRAMRDVKARAPLAPADLLEDAAVCPLSGERAGAACPDRVHRVFPRGHAPTATCHVHQWASVRSAPPGEPPYICNHHGNVTIGILPDSFARWLETKPMGAPGSDPHGIPWFVGSRVPGCAPSAAEQPQIELVAPVDGAVLIAERGRAAATNDAIDVVVQTHGLPPSEPLVLMLDGRATARLDSPYRARVAISRGDHLLEVRPSNADRAARLGRAAISVR
ncbi:MAG: penicillin-binding protein 1C [Polyangiaceae bacterium]|nr:penicillin-binding protein 1C [Polyangiaceae bacterium]